MEERGGEGTLRRRHGRTSRSYRKVGHEKKRKSKWNSRKGRGKNGIVEKEEEEIK